MEGKTLDEVIAQPPQEWLIADVLPEHGTSLLYGKSGVGKSFLGADMVYAVLTGLPWHGKRVKRGAVVYIATEGSEGLGKRFLALRQRADKPQESPALFTSRPVNLLDKEEVAEFVADVQALGGVRLVVLDTLNRCMPGADENSNAVMSQAVTGAERIAGETGAHVLLMHHTGKNGVTARGGYALECNTDARLRIGTQTTPALKPGGILTLYDEKKRDAGNTPPLKLQTELVTLPDGSTTLVLSDGLGKRTPRRKDTNKQVLAYHAQGKANAWIAEKLDMKAGTVSSIISRDTRPTRAHLRAVS